MKVKGIKQWLITDTHWHHDATKRFCNRPEDYNQKIRSLWESMIGTEDIVWHLGDVVFYRHKEFKEWFPSLPGRKLLIRGNHDKKSYSWYLEAGFTCVLECAVVKFTEVTSSGPRKGVKVLLTHKPRKIPSDVDICIYGHTHLPRIEHRITDTGVHLTDNHYLLSLEHVNYRPVLLSRARFDKEVLPTREILV